MIHLCFWLLILFSAFAAKAPWDASHGMLFTAAGVLMIARRPTARLPRAWWLLAAGFLLFGALAFLPASWFGIPAWRGNLAALGVATGTRQAIQGQQAAETLALFGIVTLVGLWLAGHRATAASLRLHCLLFVLGVAAYAIAARVNHDPAAPQTFGFFPNRNHTATFLSMGSLCGLACIVQSIRDRGWAALACSVPATAVCLCGLLAWSPSRAGVILVTAGTFAWLGCLGRHYLGPHGGKAVILLGIAAVGGFVIAESPLKQRLTDSAGKIASLEIAETPEGDKPGADQLAGVDFRIPTWRDTCDMIAAAPWGGVGAGQYAVVFPQYRNLTAVQNDSDNLHPESDWLWMAAETGLPSTLSLAALVVVAAGGTLRQILRGRGRSLRAGCLIAALLVALHGVFDVPGHRVPLAWAAAWLFALSLGNEDEEPRAVPAPPAWPFRLAGTLVLLAGLWLLRSAFLEGPKPALLAASEARTQVGKLLQQDQALREAASAEGREYQPSPADDPLEQALAVVDQAQAKAPLHRSLYRLEGFLALHFDDKDDRARKAFAVERALDPTWVAAPLQQAAAWSKIDPAQTAELWHEALLRARQVDRRHPTPQRAEESRVRAQIEQQIRDNPDLEHAWSERSGN